MPPRFLLSLIRLEEFLVLRGRNETRGSTSERNGVPAALPARFIQKLIRRRCIWSLSDEIRFWSRHHPMRRRFLTGSREVKPDPPLRGLDGFSRSDLLEESQNVPPSLERRCILHLILVHFIDLTRGQKPRPEHFYGVVQISLLSLPNLRVLSGHLYCRLVVLVVPVGCKCRSGEGGTTRTLALLHTNWTNRKVYINPLGLGVGWNTRAMPSKRSIQLVVHPSVGPSAASGRRAERLHAGFMSSVSNRGRRVCR